MRGAAALDDVQRATAALRARAAAGAIGAEERAAMTDLLRHYTAAVSELREAVAAAAPPLAAAGDLAGDVRRFLKRAGKPIPLLAAE